MKRGIVGLAVAALAPAVSCIREVIIVDNSLPGDELDSVEGWLPSIPVRLIHADAKGSAAARNVGARHATGDFLVLLDDDMLLAGRLLVQIVGGLKSDLAFGFPERRYVPLEAPAVDLRRAALTNDVRWLDSASYPCPRRSGCRKASDILYRVCSIACFAVIPQAAFWDIGGFDENFEGWGLQDTEFLSRLVTRIPIRSLYGEHTLFHVDHYVSPYKYTDQEKNLSLFNDLLRSRSQTFDYYEYVRNIIRCTGLRCPECGRRKVHCAPIRTETQQQ